MRGRVVGICKVIDAQGWASFEGFVRMREGMYEGLGGEGMRTAREEERLFIWRWDSFLSVRSLLSSSVRSKLDSNVRLVARCRFARLELIQSGSFQVVECCAPPHPPTRIPPPLSLGAPSPAEHGSTWSQCFDLAPLPLLRRDRRVSLPPRRTRATLPPGSRDERCAQQACRPVWYVLYRYELGGAS